MINFIGLSKDFDNERILLGYNYKFLFTLTYISFMFFRSGFLIKFILLEPIFVSGLIC